MANPRLTGTPWLVSRRRSADEVLGHPFGAGYVQDADADLGVGGVEDVPGVVAADDWLRDHRRVVGSDTADQSLAAGRADVLAPGVERQAGCLDARQRGGAVAAGMREQVVLVHVAGVLARASGERGAQREGRGARARAVGVEQREDVVLGVNLLACDGAAVRRLR